MPIKTRHIVVTVTERCVMLLALLVLNLCVSVNALPSQHGALYSHLDCSSCLAVATVLSKRMNTSLKESAPTVLLTQRLDHASERQRHTYKTTELRAVEVLERMCSEIYFSLHRLRLNPKTKVRTYHRVRYEELHDANQTEFLESDVFPSSETFEMKRNLTLFPLAQLYTKKEHEQLSAVYPNAPIVMCDIMMAEFEDEMTDIVKYANWKSEVDAKLCGLGLHNKFSTEYQELEKHVPVPVTNVCSDVDALQKSANLDQRRWYATEQIKKKLNATVDKDNNADQGDLEKKE